MARTIQQIHQALIEAKEAEPQLSELNSTSKVAVWRIWLYIMAVGSWALESILDIAIRQQNTFIANMKIHSFAWYAAYAVRFQYGSTLPWGSVEYDNTGLSEEDIALLEVVKYAACVKSNNGLKVKIAGVDGGGNLQPVTAPQLAAFEAYMFRISAAGDNLTYGNDIADSLKLQMDVYYDPLIINGAGERIDGAANTPVEDAIVSFLKRMDFNGVLIPAYLIDAIQAVDGVKIPHITSIQSTYGALPYSDVPPHGVNPNAGYIRLAGLIINYIPKLD